MSRVSAVTVIILALSIGQQPAQAQTTAADWIKKAQELTYSGDDQGAYQACSMAIKLEPNNVAALNLRADANLPWAIANMSNAQRDYAKAITLDPQNYHALTYRGFLSHIDSTAAATGDLENAIKILKAKPNRTADQERIYALANFWTDMKSSLPVVKRLSEHYPNDTEALYLLGCSLDAAGQFNEAKLVFKKNQALLASELQKHCTGDICRQIFRGCTSFQDYSVAIKVFSDYLEKHPDNVHALYWRGYLYIAQRSPKEALKDYARSLKLGPTYQVHTIAFADAEFAQKNYLKAEHLYKQAITADPGSEAYISKHALCLNELNRAALAIQEIDQYLAKNPHSYNLLKTKALIERKANPKLARQDLKLALNLISQKIQLTPDMSQLYTLRCAIYQDLKEPQKALADIDQAIRLKPDDANLYSTRAFLKWSALSLKEDAVADEIRAVEWALFSVKRAYLVILSSYYTSMKQYDKAIGTADRCIALNPDFPEGYKMRAAAYTALGRFQNALADLQKIGTLSVELDDIDLLLARVYVSLNKQKEALTAFDTSLRKHPDDLEARVARGVFHSQMEHYDLALADFNKALTIAQDNGEVYFARSQAYTGMGEYLKAASDVTTAMELTKLTNAPWVLEERAHLYTYAERYNEAASDLAKAHRYALDKPIYLYQCGKLLYWSGNKIGAIDSISAYLKQVQDPLALRARARCYFETDQFDKSIADYSSLIEYDPGNPALYRLRAQSYLKSNKEQLASADLNKAKTLMKPQ